MKKRPLNKIDLDLYEEELDNGLKIFVIPKNNCNDIYVTFTTKYGSYQNEFVPYKEKEIIKVPEGVAHFLEHKLFDQKDGIDPFTFFGKTGTDSNASTSTYKTQYLFEGPNNFEENLNYLLDFVQEPYFTDENVEQEKGIIVQELKMYQDNPMRMLYEKSLWNTFNENPIRYSVGGTVDSVNSITKEDLYTCYQTFYHSSNMMVVITGNVEPDKAIEIIRKNQQKKKFKEMDKIVVKSYEEPEKVFKEYEALKMNVSIPKISVNYKFDISAFDFVSVDDLLNYLSIFVDCKFGTTSLFQEKLIQDKIITGTIDFSIIYARTHFVIMLIAESKVPKEFVKRLNEEIQSLALLETDFERKKKTILSSMIYASDNIFSMNNKVVNNILLCEEVNTDTYNSIKNMSFNTLNRILEDMNFNNKAVVVVESKNC